MVRLADQTVLATAETNWAFISLSKQSPQRIPPEVAESFEILAEADEP
jgi:acyl-CoA thioesterase FadM